MSSSLSLPPGWCAFTDETSGKTYYAHTASGQVRWDPPPSAPPPPPMPSSAPAPAAPLQHPTASHSADPRIGQTLPHFSSDPRMIQTPASTYSQASYITPRSEGSYQMPMSMPPHSMPSNGMYHPNPIYQMTPPPAPAYSSYPSSGYNYKRTASWDYQSNKRPYYGSSYGPSQPIHQQPTEPKSKTCSRCSKELLYENYAKRQWMKRDDERKCKECVKKFLEEKHAPPSVTGGSSISENSLSKAKRVSPSSTVTNDAAESASGKSEATRRCAGCNEFCTWKEYTKTQWVSPAFTRKCKKCKEEEKLERKRQDQEEGINALLMMAKDSPAVVDKHVPERVASASASSNVSTTTNETKGILKPVSNVVVKEEMSDDESAAHQSKAATSNSHTKPTIPIGVRYAHENSTRKCSKCGKEENWEHFTKTQWLMSAMFRRCRECMSGEIEAAADSSSTYINIESRKWMYEDADVPRKCVACNFYREWIHFSKRQWIMHDSERKCKQCVDHMLNPNNKE